MINLTSASDHVIEPYALVVAHHRKASDRTPTGVMLIVGDNIVGGRAVLSFDAAQYLQENLNQLLEQIAQMDLDEHAQTSMENP